MQRILLTLIFLSHAIPRASVAQTPGKKPPTEQPAAYQLKPGEFPPAGSEKKLSGELIALDHVNRAGVLRMDRADEQTRPQWDRPSPFTLLPFATVMYHGAPAELRDIPIGTHLHGHFYEGEKVPQFPAAYVPALGSETRLSIYLRFSRASRLEDDFSRDQSSGRTWRVESLNVESGKLTVTGIRADKQADKQATVFDIGPEARVWKGKGFGTLADVRAGQSVLVNLTLCTLFGAGRVVEIWLDDESRAAATAHQLEKHLRYQRQHGVAGWIDAVDNRTGEVFITLFPGVHAKLFDDFNEVGICRVATAQDSLRTYWTINDNKAGPATTLRVPAGERGAGGMRVTITVGRTGMLEGFRPTRIVRVWPGDGKTIPGWHMQELPKEEQLIEQ